MGAAPKLELKGSPHFSSWLAEHKLSLAFTTYQVGKLFLLGLQGDGRLSVFERTFNRCMGMWCNGTTLYMSNLYQLWRFENTLEQGQTYQGYDRLYVPRLGYTTGKLDIHDVAVDGDDRVIFVNTLFNCLATVSETHSFVPVWRPPFISRFVAEDRCHLNGLAMEKGRPKYVTALGRSDIADGWREKRRDGGCVIEVDTGEILNSGLSMPHAPRVYRDRLWLLESGSGQLGYVDLQTGWFEPVAFCPGYLRGLTFIGDFAIVGLSRPRDNKTFTGLALDDELSSRKIESYCGLSVIDLNTGEAVHELRIDGVVEELYDVVALPGVRCPMALGFRNDEIQRTISIGHAQPESGPIISNEN